MGQNCKFSWGWSELRILLGSDFTTISKWLMTEFANFHGVRTANFLGIGQNCEFYWGKSNIANYLWVYHSNEVKNANFLWSVTLTMVRNANFLGLGLRSMIANFLGSHTLT